MSVNIDELRALKAPWAVFEYENGEYEDLPQDGGGTPNADYVVALVNAAEELLAAYEEKADEPD